MARAGRVHIAVLALCLGALTASTAPAADRQQLVPLVRDLPWRHVSGLIGYGDRLWFVNSRKYVNHNSADIYTYDPATGKARYERHLFSQDAGDPVVYAGLLYWPFEDSRWSPGRGEFMVTNGRDWRWGLLPDQEAFHVHAMTRHDGALYAAPSAWKAGVQRSRDLGATWSPVYTHETPEKRVSRITTLHSAGGTLFAGLSAWYESEGAKLLRLEGGSLRPTPGWPDGQAASGMVVHRGWLYVDNDAGERGGSAIWRTDGRRVERVEGLEDAGVRAMASGADALWAVTAAGNGGALFRSDDGVAWKRVQHFDGIVPAAVAVYGGQVYVGGREGGRGGVLLGPAAPAPAEAPLPRRTLPEKPAAPIDDAAAALDQMEQILGNAMRYSELRDHMVRLARFRDPAVGQALARRLDGRFPYSQASMFGGQVKVPAAKMARWFLMWAMAHNGNGQVPLRLIRWPWDAEKNRAEKYLEPAPGAAWAAAELHQDDSDTIGTLIGRLNVPGDPDWLHGDMIGALTALTGERFGYDRRAWGRWWESRPKAR